MKKSLSLLLTTMVSLFLLLTAVSCSADSGITESNSSSTATGKISGKVTFSNVDESANGGIMVTLDKTDGLRTLAVSHSVSSRSLEDSARTVVDNSITAKDGSYSFSNLEPGTYTVYAASTYSAERAVCTNVVVRSAETTIADTLKLTATGSIRGTITIDENESGNTGFLVFVAGTSYMAMTDDAGNYTISAVPAGSGYQLVATKNGGIFNLDSYVLVNANEATFMSSFSFSSNELDSALKGEKGETVADGKDGTSLVWLGAYSSDGEIENPQYLNAYFNTTDGCSYIYNGYNWELLARSGANGADGKDGKSIRWRGEYSSPDEITDIQEFDAYYNSSTGSSYIYISGGWMTLASKGDKGEDGESINWCGSFASSDEISEPKNLYAYYNYNDGCSYIYIWGAWKPLAAKGEQGEEGKSLNWRGSFASSDEISNPQYLDAYFNSTDGCSYIYTFGVWEKLASKGDKGEEGADGKSIYWAGEYPEIPDAAYAYCINNNAYYAYYNTTDGCSYIWNGASWNLLSKVGSAGADGQNGTNGISITWKGELSSAPTNPELNWAYYNTETGCSYIFNGTEWDMLAKIGKTGSTGADGKSLDWQGELSQAPSEPVLNWAYYNSTDGCAYIWTGTSWEVLAKAGTSITWLGSYAFSSEITNPENLNAYYNTTDGCSYIYNGTEWHLLSRKGSDGATVSGGSGSGGITWLGDFADSSEIISPEVLSAYYNTTTGCSYIWNGTEWKLLAKAGTDGADGESINWLGELPSDSAVVSPKYLDAYYNTTNGCSYIYTGTKWELLAKSAPEQNTIEFSNTYNIGDVLLSDGTVIPYQANRVFTNEQKQKAVGVMYGNEFNIPCGWLGIYNSCSGTASGTYKWARADTTGYNTSFTETTCDFASNSSVTSGSFSGTIDGSNNWSQICSVDSYATAMIEKNYPAFNYANKYATRFGLTGNYTSGWYMPSFAELCFIYRNKTILNKVLNALGGTQLQNVQYWSSSQHPDWDDDARYVDFSNGDASDGLNNGGKEQEKYVCVVHSFSSDTTPPSTVSNLSATYNRNSKVITVSWTNPYASDLAYVRISYTKNETTIISKAPVYGDSGAPASYTVNDVELDGSTYKFTIVALDKRGNTSTSTTTSITLTNAEPEFTEFIIPTVNYLKEGNTVIATITGKNFNTATLDPSIKFAATCPSKPLIVENTVFETQSDTLITASFTITGKIGEYDITISYGEKEIIGTLKVQDFGTYSPGDVLLSDGTIVHCDTSNLTFTDEQKAKAVGVLYCDEYGVPAGWLGIHNSAAGANSGYYAWAKANTVGYTTNFTDIICSQKTSGSLTFFAGDTDGKDNWEYICDMYPVAAAEAATYFPAFDYVNKYASTFGLTGEYASGWYMPSIAEIYYAFKSYTILNAVLSALGGTQLATGNYYWSSSQHGDYYYSVWQLRPGYGPSRSTKDAGYYYVCCVRPFN